MKISRKQFFAQALAGIAGLGAVAMGKSEVGDGSTVTVVDEPLFGDPTMKEWKDLTLEEHQVWFDKVINFKPSNYTTIPRRIPIGATHYDRNTDIWSKR